MPQLLLLTQVGVSIALIGCILLQAQGSGLGTSWSGGGESYHTRRGVEKIVFSLTIALIGLFFILSLVVVLNA